MLAGYGSKLMAWLVAVTEPRRESVAQSFISKSGRTSYYPRFRDVCSDSVQPLFPRYIFVHTTDGIWRFLLNTVGVVKVLVNGNNQAQLMKDEIVDSLKSKESRNGVIVFDRFQIGEKVFVFGNNPFAGHVGVYLGMSTAERCRIMLSLLGQDVKVSMDPKCLRAAS